jgi:DNA repair protein RecN (Recombination protein N)
MLHAIRVRDLATVADVTLELGAGLNVLTGETGAGKSMLVDALALLLGDRADRAAVRPGAQRAVVEGEFDAGDPSLAWRLTEAGVDAEERLVIRREVSAEGRSRAWVNGSPTAIGVLASLAPLLVDLHGQHQAMELARAAAQRDLLDAWADAGDAAQVVADAHRETTSLREEMATLTARRDDAVRRADWLRHVVAEIEQVRPVSGEDETLAVEASRLAQAGTLGEQARQIVEMLDAERTGIRDRLGRLGRAIDQLARLDPPVAEWRQLVDASWAGLDELSRAATEYAQEVAEDPDRLDRVERRRELLDDLKRKHGGNLAAVLDTRRAAADELDLIDRAAIDLGALQRRVDAAEVRLKAAAATLSDRRMAAGERLGGEVTRMLPGLGLPGAELSVSLQPVTPIGSHGAETVEFLARLNSGMATRPIAGAASGGELSRLMLALKVAVARHDDTPTLVFDEIDQGIGGEVGGQVGAALERVAARHQVLVITHLPQIAARADRHLLVAKGTRAGVATSDVQVLLGEDRVTELARMLGDADDPHALRLATAMLSR